MKHTKTSKNTPKYDHLGMDGKNLDFVHLFPDNINAVTFVPAARGKEHTELHSSSSPAPRMLSLLWSTIFTVHGKRTRWEYGRRWAQTPIFPSIPLCFLCMHPHAFVGWGNGNMQKISTDSWGTPSMWERRTCNRQRQNSFLMRLEVLPPPWKKLTLNKSCNHFNSMSWP